MCTSHVAATKKIWSNDQVILGRKFFVATIDDAPTPSVIFLGEKAHLHPVWFNPIEKNINSRARYICQKNTKNTKNLVNWTNLVWLVVEPALWKLMEFLSWDDDIPNIWVCLKMVYTPNEIAI